MTAATGWVHIRIQITLSARGGISCRKYRYAPASSPAGGPPPARPEKTKTKKFWDTLTAGSTRPSALYVERVERYIMKSCVACSTYCSSKRKDHGLSVTAFNKWLGSGSSNIKRRRSCCCDTIRSRQ